MKTLEVRRNWPLLYIQFFSDFVTGVERFFLRKFEGGGWDSDMVGSFWMMSGMKSMNGIIALLLSLGVICWEGIWLDAGAAS